MFKVCPKCLSIARCYERDFLTGSIMPLKVPKCCGFFLTPYIYNSASCSNNQRVKSISGRLSTAMEFNSIQKKQFFENIKKFKQMYNTQKDYKIIEMALNSMDIDTLISLPNFIESPFKSRMVIPNENKHKSPVVSPKPIKSMSIPVNNLSNNEINWFKLL